MYLKKTVDFQIVPSFGNCTTSPYAGSGKVVGARGCGSSRRGYDPIRIGSRMTGRLQSGTEPIIYRKNHRHFITR